MSGNLSQIENDCRQVRAVRQMTAADVSAIATMERQAFSDPWSEEALLAETCTNPKGRSYVALVDERLAAYLIYWSFAGEGHIARIVVEKDHQRRGIGSALLSQCLKRMRQDQIGEVYLEVRSSNAAAIKLYTKSGFEKVGVRKNYYFRDREDAILMRLTLKEGKNELV